VRVFTECVLFSFFPHHFLPSRFICMYHCYWCFPCLFPPHAAAAGFGNTSLLSVMALFPVCEGISQTGEFWVATCRCHREACLQLGGAWEDVCTAQLHRSCWEVLHRKSGMGMQVLHLTWILVRSICTEPIYMSAELHLRCIPVCSNCA